MQIFDKLIHHWDEREDLYGLLKDPNSRMSICFVDYHAEFLHSLLMALEKVLGRGWTEESEFQWCLFYEYIQRNAFGFTQEEVDFNSASYSHN